MATCERKDDSMNIAYLTKLVDPDNQIELLMSGYDVSTREAIVTAAKEIRQSNHTPEQISGILSILMAHGKESLTEEDLIEFQDIEPAENTEPYPIPITKENYKLIYSFLTEKGDYIDSMGTTELKKELDDLLIVSEEREQELTAQIESLKTDLEEQSSILKDYEDQIFIEAVVPYQNLPIDTSDRAWDEGEARKALMEYAKDSKGNVNWAKYRKGFVWYDSEADDKAGSYKFPIATVEDGKLTAIKRGVYAAAASINKAKVSDSDKAGIRSHLGKYYKKMNETPPWDKESEEPDKINKELEDSRELTRTLEAKLAELIAEKHVLLAKEAARLSIEKGHPLSKTKSFDDLVELFTGRSEEYLKIHIEDLSSIEVSPATEDVEKLEDPTLHQETGMTAQTTEVTKEALQEDLYSKITDEEETTITLMFPRGKKAEELREKLAKIKG